MTSIVKCWRRFCQYRRRDDRVKVMLLLACIGIGFFLYAVYSGIQAYTMVKTPVEYILNGNGHIYNIENMEDAAAVSMQRESSLTLSGPWGEMTVACVELSESYLTLAYGISETSAMKVIYLNQMAYEQLLQASNSENASKSAKEMQAVYILGDEEEKGEAKIRVIPGGVQNNTACAFCSGSSVSLSEGDGAIRVQMAGHDLDGLNAARIGQFGFQIVNAFEVQQASMELEMQFMRIKYGCLVAVLCLIAVISLGKYGRHT